MTDLPFHTDCGMGYHPVACPMVLVGVHLDPGTPETGQLHVLPGSHIASTPDPAFADTAAWPVVALATEPGDCSVHISHTLHAAPPPTGREHTGRRTFYLAFAPPSLFDAVAPMEDLVAAMQGEDGITKTVDQVLPA
jgi:ectoine hydroxylase-related dioxygenase (phytanoyl-CoA dioxygenase family)